ncbi:MAG: endonuclease/exonuclease/phosphatase family protein [Planctomycetia bacterium]|nr:endonuclease/exonuclease/phosphatase family protein [Planctomycetia bacterium]
MRIATWNLNRPKMSEPGRSATLQERIRQLEADVWILTETNENVSPGNGFQRAVSSTISGYHDAGESRTTIWSRFPVLQQIGTHDPDTAVCIEVDSPVGPLLVYGTVIPYHDAGTRATYRSAGRDQVGMPAWQLHHESIPSHEADWRRIREKFPTHHICVGGDFNQSRDGHLWNGRLWYGTEEGRKLLSDSLNRVGLVCKTEEDFVESGKLTTRSTVEHICLNEALAQKVKDVDAWEAGEFGNKKLSDHNGLHIDIE